VLRDKSLFDFGPAGEPHGFIKPLALDILIDPVGDGAREMSRHWQKSDPKLFGLLAGAQKAQFVESYV
jgi:hypothetical protein